MIEQVIKYDDGTETVIAYRRNPDDETIEEQVAEAQAEIADVEPTVPTLSDDGEGEVIEGTPAQVE